MIPRGKLAITWQNLLSALSYSFSLNRQKKEILPHGYYGESIFCLSVRTGLDLTLRALNFAPKSEIIVSQINIPDMFVILDAHQLKSIPIAIDQQSLAIAIDEIRSKITPDTRALLITHLFGAIINLDEVVALAKQHQLIVIEDCAQAFNHQYKGHPQSDVILFSFGLIKTTTSLTGALICFNHHELFEKVGILNQQLPIQSRKKYIAKLFKAAAIKVVTVKWIYTALYQTTKWLKIDFDNFLAGLTKGFPGDDVIQKIAFRPSLPNLRLLQKRTDPSASAVILKRKKIAEEIIENLPIEMQIGRSAYAHTHWVLPIKSNNPAKLIAQLRQRGVDASAKASSLITLRSSFSQKKPEDLDLEQLVYLPIDQKVIAALKQLQEPE